jgi:glycosyltransferase involved in cell wall biosynthesis
MIDWILGARCVVLPLQEPTVSAGQVAMLESMALARPVIVTRNPAVQEYAVHGNEVLFYDAGDAMQLREQILFLWHHPEAATEMGHRARRKAATLPDRQVSELLEVLVLVQPMRHRE